MHLSAADENYGNTFSLFNATSSGPTTSDGGKTWHIDSIEFAKDYLYEDGSVQECSEAVFGMPRFSLPSLFE